MTAIAIIAGGNHRFILLIAATGDGGRVPIKRQPRYRSRR